MKKSRRIFDDAKIRNITQGSIFNGGTSCLYTHHNVLGLIITPRCDIAQHKVPYYYYLPMVSFEDWKKVEFPDLYIAKLRNETFSRLRNELKNVRISESIVNHYTAKKIGEIIAMTIGRIPKNLNKALKQLSDVEQYEEKKENFSKLVETYDGPKKEVFREIAANKNLNYYLLEGVDDFWLVRMRELNRLTPSVLFKLQNGIDSKLTDQELLENDICQYEGELFLPLYEIQSPYIEHIMQHFLSSFNRIGVEDMHKDVINDFLNSNI